MASSLRYCRPESTNVEEISATVRSPRHKSTAEKIVLIAYFLYTAVLVGSVALYVLDKRRLAKWVVLSVVSLHFLGGLLLSLSGTVSLEERYQFVDTEGHPRTIGFRGGVSLLNDFAVMPLSLATILFALFKYTNEDGAELYGVAITAAFIGNLICNLLHTLE